MVKKYVLQLGPLNELTGTRIYHFLRVQNPYLISDWFNKTLRTIVFVYFAVRAATVAKKLFVLSPQVIAVCFLF